jgi:N-acetylmuramic acid 6-phosphate etherase
MRATAARRSPRYRCHGDTEQAVAGYHNLVTASFENLPTEARSPASANIDQLSTLEMLRVINDADRTVADAVALELSSIAAAVDGIVARLHKGGRLFYIGAGTSGRLGVLDASECHPTYNVPADLVRGIMAGGDGALRFALEDVEDDPAIGRSNLQQQGLTQRDAVVGISTSGRTPYVLGALSYASSVGALTIGLSCTPNSPVSMQAALAITPVVGAEVVTGSTRMKAGTATKMVLNMLSTGAMIRLGHVYGNLMVNVQTTNQKLVDRACRIIASVANVNHSDAVKLLDEAGSVKTAIVMQRLGLSRAEAETKLALQNGHLRRTLEDRAE